MIIAAAFFIGAICMAAVLILVGLYLTTKDKAKATPHQFSAVSTGDALHGNMSLANEIRILQNGQQTTRH
jgi:archaellin